MKISCVLVALAAFVTISAASVCTSQTECTCTTAKGKIDLTPLKQTTLKATDDDGTVTYLYNPCSDNMTMPCQGAMVCRSTLMSHTAIGESSGEAFISKGNDIAIEYKGQDNTTSSTVVLKCDQNTEGELSISNASNSSYEFVLASKYACVGGPATTTPKSTTPKATKTTPKANKTTQKPTKTTSKATKTTSKATKTTSKVTKTTPKATKTTPKATKTTPKGTKTTPKGTKTTPKGTKTTPKGTKTTPRRTNTTPKMSTTTQGATATNCSLSMVALSALVVVFRQLF